MRSVIRRRPLAVAALTGVLAVGLATPASAISAPEWPEEGYTPHCDGVTVGPGDPGGFHLQYTDDTWPTMGPITFAGGATQLVVPPAGKNFVFQARMKDSCSGVGGALVYFTVNGVLASSFGMAPEVGDGRYFDVVVKLTERFNPSSAARWGFPLVQVYDRFETFTLDQDHVWVPAGEVDRGDAVWRESTSSLLVLKKTQATTKVSRSRVAAGATVTVRAAIERAGDGVWDDHVGATAVLQRKVGDGRWTEVATRSADALGHVAAKAKVNRTSSFRWVVRADTVTEFTAKAVSPAVTVKAT